MHWRSVDEDPLHLRRGTPVRGAVDPRSGNVAKLHPVRRLLQEQRPLQVQATAPYWNQQHHVSTNRDRSGHAGRAHGVVEGREITNKLFPKCCLIVPARNADPADSYWRYCPRSGLIRAGIMDILEDPVSLTPYTWAILHTFGRQFGTEFPVINGAAGWGIVGLIDRKFGLVADGSGTPSLSADVGHLRGLVENKGCLLKYQM